MVLSAYNPLTDNLEKTNLTESISVGVTSLPVYNTNNISEDDRILIGELGRERSEVVTVNAAVTDDDAIPVAATAFPHNADDPIYVLRYDEIRWYRSTTGVDGSYSLLATVPIDVDNEDLMTQYDDVGALDSYYYKITFYHSIDTTESELSDPIPAGGYDRGTVGHLINEFFREVHDETQQHMTVLTAVDLLNECNDDMTSQSRKPFRWLRTNATLTLTADTNSVDLPDNFLKMNYAKYRYVFGNEDRTDRIRFITEAEMDYLAYDNTALPSDDLMYVSIDETNKTLRFFPTPETTQAAKLTVNYYAKYATLDSMSDVLETPNQRVYKLFLMGRYYRSRAVKEQGFLNLSDRYLQDYGTEMVKLQRLNNLDAGLGRSMKPDDSGHGGLVKY